MGGVWEENGRCSMITPNPGKQFYGKFILDVFHSGFGGRGEFPGSGENIQAGEEFRAVAVADGYPFLPYPDGVARPDADVVKAYHIAVVEADKEVSGQLLHEHPKRLRHGDAFFVPEIEVAVTPARLDVKDVTVEVFPKIVVLTNENAVTLVTEYRQLSRELVLHKIAHSLNY